MQDEIRADLRAAFKRKARDEWVKELMPADACVAPVLGVAELVDDPQFVARRTFVDADHPSQGRFRQTAPVLAGQVRPDHAYQLRDWSRSDTSEILTDAGFSKAEIEQLLAEGAVA